MREERDTLHLLPQWASLNKVVLDLLDQYQPALAVKRLGTGLDLDPSLPLSWADRAQLQFGIGRVLSHAVKQSRRGGLIVCRTAIEGDWLSLTIGNDGPRLSPEQVAAIEAHTDGPEGSRGAEADLASARAIVDAHGGRIEMDMSHDRGSWFVLRLPAIAQENERLLSALADSERGRSDLVSSLSYELRTPLHVIMGYTDLLIEGAFGYMNRDQLDTLRRVDQGARELLYVIDGAVDLRALDARRAPLELRQGQLPDLVRGCCQLIVEVLSCDVGQAWVWQPATDVYVPVASHGAQRGVPAPPREARLPRLHVAQILGRRNGHGPAVEVDARELFVAPADYAHGLSRCLVVPLQRNGLELGLLVGGARHSGRSFAPEQMQVAQGIADLAGMALENARLAEELAQTQRLKTELVASLSHRFRIPLDVIIGYAELMLDDQFGALTPEQRGVMRQLRSSGVELLEALNRLVSVSRN
ncbi:MAG: histidine kinase dimerization/phospho-acceptor domain-containing protein [Candidatus Binatia bacterium]